MRCKKKPKKKNLASARWRAFALPTLGEVGLQTCLRSVSQFGRLRARAAILCLSVPTLEQIVACCQAAIPATEHAPCSTKMIRFLSALLDKRGKPFSGGMFAECALVAHALFLAQLVAAFCCTELLFRKGLHEEAVAASFAASQAKIPGSPTIFLQTTDKILLTWNLQIRDTFGTMGNSEKLTHKSNLGLMLLCDP